MTEGQLFRQLRQDRNLSLQQVADDLNSVSFISKFEKGNSQISFKRLERLLENINVTWEEFIFLRDKKHYGSANYQHVTHQVGYISGPYYRCWEEIQAISEAGEDEQDYDGAIIKLQEIISTLDEHILWQRFLMIGCEVTIYNFTINKAGKKALSDLSIQQVRQHWELLSRPVLSYLYSVENWGLFEVYIFRHFLYTFPIEKVENLLPLALARTHKELGLPMMKELRFDLLGAAFSAFSNLRMQTEAQEILQQMKANNLDGRDLVASTRYLFYQGWYQIIFGDLTSGQEKCQQAVSVFKILEQPTYAQNHQEMLATVLRNHKNPNGSILFN